MAPCQHCHRHHPIWPPCVDVPKAADGPFLLLFWGLVALGLWLKFGGYASIIHWLKGVF